MGREHKGYKNSFPNTTLRAEHDLTEQIAHLIRLSYSWVNGYQDNEIAATELSLLAQLNIEADQITAYF